MTETTANQQGESLEQILAKSPLYNLPHPYARYGLAVALMQATKDWEFGNAVEKDLPEILAREIEAGLNHFRLETQDDPESADVLRFGWISLERLRNDRSLIKGKLWKVGKYLAPTIISTDDDVKKIAVDKTFDKAEDLIKALREGINLGKGGFKLTRSFAPTTSKINNGTKSPVEPKTLLLEAVCTLITTVTEFKPAARIGQYNTAIIPDLPLSELIDFAELFKAMVTTQLGDSGNPYHVKIERNKNESATTKRRKSEKPKAVYKRPRIFNGNYPFAPRNTAFGAVGLLAAIGRWAVRAHEEDWAQEVLESLTGKPLYIISYDGVSQVQFSHHVVELAKKDKLSDVINKLAFETQIYSELDNNNPRWKIPAYQLFDLLANRFLQLFDRPTFQDFLAIRAEYAPEVITLFEEYFMGKNEMEIVKSARALGSWINYCAWSAASEGVENPKSEAGKLKIQKEKAKFLAGLESSIIQAKDQREMLYRAIDLCGRATYMDAPNESIPFMDAVNNGEVELKDARHMLIAYMRVRSSKGDVTKNATTSVQSDNSTDPYDQ
jgi:hypothetical protein